MSEHLIKTIDYWVGWTVTVGLAYIVGRILEALRILLISIALYYRSKSKR